MKKKILCWSRSYLSKLYPTIAKNDPDREYFHIVQNTAEEKRVVELGGHVVLNIEKVVKAAIRNKSVDCDWCEPQDFRELTGFEWSPMYTDRYLLNLPASIRLKVAGAVYQGIDELFTKYKFDYFLSEPVALFTTHLLYYFCKKNNTEPRLWVNCYFPGYFFFASELDYSCPQPRIASRSAGEIEAVDAVIDEFCAGVVEDKAGPAYHFSFAKDVSKNLNYFKQRVGEASLVLMPGIGTKAMQLLRLARSFYFKTLFPMKGDFQSAASFKEHVYYLKCLMTPKRYYDSIPSEDDSVVTYTLQYEPEASLLYAAPHFFNQLSFVENILRSLPADKTLYVKEHPNQFGALGLEEWRDLRKKYHNVRFIYGRESGRALIKASSLVVTISSTAGMDGILLGKPVIVAGNVFYNKYLNVTQISSNKEFPSLLKAPPLPASREEVMQDVLISLKDMASNAYLGDPQPSPVLYSTANMKRLVTAIAAECV
jgi:hypothetical protein